MIRTVVALALVGIAAPAFGGESKRFLSTSQLYDVSVPVRSMQEMRFAGVVRQRYDFSCGSAALATLLRMYGDPHDEIAAFRGMWAEGDRAQIRKLGFSLLDMQRYLKARGITGNGYKVSLDAIRQAGVPGIALINRQGYRHFVIIQGVPNGEELVADPSLGLRVEQQDRFQEQWNGVLFVLDSAAPRGKAVFNQPARWAAYPRPPFSRAAGALAQQSLQLAMPGYGEC